ncbi:MAG: beta-hydroxyacyl-ACP dehydratase [Eubacteriales bacterium]|nr:beta-hydroxyacyl-ACP dehydratase [Eubacteriales bacterium]
MNREEMKKLLPHREPMLLVDEAYLDEDGVAHGAYRVRGDEFFLRGHFPGNPIVPGVIQCEIMAQVAGLLFVERLKGHTPLYVGIDKVKFRGVIRPGDTLRVRISLQRIMGQFFFTKGESWVEDKRCASGELSFALVPGISTGE